MAAARVENQKKAVEVMLAAWHKLDIEGMVSVRAPDCLQAALPTRALGEGGDKTNEEVVAMMKPVFATLKDFRSETLSVSHDGEAGRSIVHAHNYGQLPVGPYNNEHIMILHFNEEGTKMTRVEDMVDSAFMLDVHEKFAKAKQSWHGKEN